VRVRARAAEGIVTVQFNGRDYVLTRQGRQRIAPGANEIGATILDFVAHAPVDCAFERLMKRLLDEYDVDAELLESDVRQFVQHCIDTEALAEPGRLKLHGLDLSITNQCNASCVYCPTPRIDAPKRFLTLDEVGKLIDDLSTTAFKEEFGTLSTIEIGGLSEPLLHPQALDILREFKRRYPTPFTVLYTNGVLLKEERATALLDEGLITSLVVSVDGMGHREHFATKGVRYAAVEKNLMRFIRERDDRAAECRVIIHVLPYTRYRALVRKHLNRDPLIVPRADDAPKDRTEDIIGKWSARVSKIDEVRSGADYFQLRGEYKREGDTFAVPESELDCPWFDYVAQSISVTSNGDVLICCNDFQKEGVLGNYLETSLYDVASGPRREFVEKLARDDRAGLPGRCGHRKYCQFLSFDGAGETHALQR
jgi:MoaA/NifB/PqqE/SkfB family radical SAM enzyme